MGEAVDWPCGLASRPDRGCHLDQERKEVLEDFRSAEDTSNGETGRTSLNAGSMRGSRGEGLVGKNCCKSVLLIWVGEEAFSSVGKQSGALPAAISGHLILMVSRHQ